MSSLVLVPPYHFIHILDLNKSVAKLICGPIVYTKKENESVILPPTEMVTICPSEYCIISNPVKKDKLGNVIFGKYGEACLNFGEDEYRFTQIAFPLYPGEKIKKPPFPLLIVNRNNAINVKSLLSYVSEDGIKREPGMEWMIKGPCLYKPKKEEIVTEHAKLLHISSTYTYSLIASFEHEDVHGHKRRDEEKWLISEPGAYLVGPYEKVHKRVKKYALTTEASLHLKALDHHIDVFGKTRYFKDEWLVTHEDTDSYYCNVNQKLIAVVSPIKLSSLEYCIVENVVDDDGFINYGKRKVIRGPGSFFLKPKETLSGHITLVHVLTKYEALIIKARETFFDGKENRLNGEIWMLMGPLEYVPVPEVEVMSVRKSISLSESEGVYVKNRKTGEVRSVIGMTFMLQPDEELWKKYLPPIVEKIVREAKDPLSERGDYINDSTNMTEELDLTRVVRYQVPSNAAVRVYDYRTRTSRVVFGPALVLLDVHEEFTVISLSAGVPKQADRIKSICLLLGPDFCVDLFTVTTADHARLSLRVSYSWQFQLAPEPTAEEADKIFTMPDFIGNACKTLASKIRAVVAGIPFDVFHKASATIIHSAVFSAEDSCPLLLPENSLLIANVDVLSVQPVDKFTQDLLQSSVQRTIDLTISSQEATAKYEAEEKELIACGQLESQLIEDEIKIEEARVSLIQLQLETLSIQTLGLARAEAESQTEADLITNQTQIIIERTKAKANTIVERAKVDSLCRVRDCRFELMLREKEVAFEYLREATEIETSQYERMLAGIGADNLSEIACARDGRDLKLLKELNLTSTVITSGKRPINLLNTASGLIGVALQSA